MRKVKVRVKQTCTEKSEKSEKSEKLKKKKQEHIGDLAWCADYEAGKIPWYMSNY